MKSAVWALLACAALQACTTPSAPPPERPAPTPPPSVAVPPEAPPPVPVPPPLAPTNPTPVAPANAAETPRDPAVDPRGLCDGRTEGARVQTTGPRGEPIVGVCRRGANGWLQFSREPRR